MFQEICMNICDRDSQLCHRLKDKDWTIVKFTTSKDFLRILRVKRQLKGLDPAVVDLPEGTESFVPSFLGDMEQMQKVNAQIKSASILYNKWFNWFTNWGIWSGKNYHPYVWPTECVPDIEIDTLSF